MSAKGILPNNPNNGQEPRPAWPASEATSQFLEDFYTTQQDREVTQRNRAIVALTIAKKACESILTGSPLPETFDRDDLQFTREYLDLLLVENLTGSDDLTVDSADSVPSLEPTEENIRFCLDTVIPYLQGKLNDAVMTVQQHPAICPPQDQKLATLAAGLIVLRREVHTLEMALYRYLVGEINETQWLDIYSHARPTTQYAAMRAIYSTGSEYQGGES